jgi:succinate dehydrogenase/fumarate reductase flavoprotein subunit|tara:strand:+ start:123 stop:539 length:417 start_codon:yes stop_codon:yes gene_type:complete
MANNNNRVDVSDKTAISMPMRNLISILAAVAVGVYAFFGIQERLNNVETRNTLMEADLVKNTEFRIKWPRGELGSLPADSEQFMLIEYMDGQLTKVQAQIESMMHNKVNIMRLQEDMKEARENIEKLKDKVREANGNN